MKSTNIRFSRKAIASSLLLILCMAAGAQAQDSQPPATAPQPLIPWQGYASFGIVGITRNQTARLNVAWVSTGCRPFLFPSDSAAPDSIFVPQVPVQLLFLDARGNPIARHGGPIRPGQAVSLDLPGNGDALASRFDDRRRASIRAVALLPGVPLALLSPCLVAFGTPTPAPPEPVPQPNPGDGNPVTPVSRPYLYPYPIPVSDSVFKLSVEVFNEFGETTVILENPTFVNGISPWPLAIAAPDLAVGGNSGAAPPAPVP